MSKFTGPLNIAFADDDHAAWILEPIQWDCDELGSGLRVTIPFGFVSDGASLPRFLWWFMPPWGDRATRAAILHDWLYWNYEQGTPIPGAETRRAYDRQFLLALKVLGVKPVRRHLLWIGIRAYSIGRDLGLPLKR